MRFQVQTMVLASCFALFACGGETPSPQVPANPAPAAPSAPASSALPATPAMTAPSAAAPGAEEQIAAGKKIYADKCASCHGATGEGDARTPAAAGRAALALDPPAKARVRKGQFRTAADVAAFVKKSMPMDEPGSLSDDTVQAVVAWELSASGVKLTKKLDAAGGAAVPLR